MGSSWQHHSFDEWDIDDYHPNESYGV